MLKQKYSYRKDSGTRKNLKSENRTIVRDLT